MRPDRSRHVVPAAIAILFSLATTPLGAGEPVPDVDVILEQIPGGTLMMVEETTGHPFDRLDFKDLPKDFAQAMDGAPLPAGWSLHKEGKKVWLQGPPPGQPVRLKIHIGAVQRPATLSYEVSLEGRKLLARQQQPVKKVAKQEVLSSLQGIAQLPTQVAPGEAMQMKVLASALPAGGSWSLSGTVSADEKPEDPAASEAPQPVARKRRVALVVPPGRGKEVPDQTIQDIATLLAARGVPEGGWEVVPLGEGDTLLDEPALEIWAVARRDQQDADNRAVAKPAQISQVMKLKHEMAMSVIQNLKGEIAAKPAGGAGPGLYALRSEASPGAGVVPILVVTGFAINEEVDPELAEPPPCESAQQSKECCRKAGGGWVESEKFGSFCFTLLETDKNCLEPLPVDTSSCPMVFSGFEIAKTPEGGRISTFYLGGGAAAGRAGGTPDSASSLLAVKNTPPSNMKSRSVIKAVPAADGTVVFDPLPDDLEPGGSLAMQYFDAFGALVVDVPSVPGVAVVEPRSGGDGEARITDASPRSFAGQLACVCGSFPGPPAWNALLLDGQAVGFPVSASGRMAWVQLAGGVAPGEHVFTGEAGAGFPSTDRATTLVLQVGGEIDSSKLKRLETTPMRLWVVGTEEPLDLRVRNLTPGIISIEGGEDQTIRTSGGARNMLERTVRGLAPGAFNINYELGGEPCPCAAGAPPG